MAWETSVRLGRAVLPSPNIIRQEGGGRLRVGHSGMAFTGSAGLIAAQQVTGYPNPDEDVIPLTYDATLAGGVLDGFYFVEGTDVDWAKLAAGVFAWEAVLVPSPDRGMAGFELVTLCGLRPNDQSIAAANAGNFVGWPASALAGRFASAAGTPIVVYGENANINTHSVSADADLSLNGVPLQFQLAAGDAYDGAATIRQGPTRPASATAPNLSAWTDVTGRSITSDPTAVLITNDIIRVLYGPSTGQLLVGQWEDSAVSGADEWTYKAYKLTTGGSSATSIGDPVAVAVLYNKPEAASVRFWHDLGSGNARHVDVTLRRGQTWAEVRISEAYSGATAAHGVFRYTTEAGTTSGVTGGVNAAGDDGDGNRYQIRVDEADTVDTTNGGLYLSSATQTAVFGISTDFFATVPQLISQFFGVSESHQEVIAR